MQNEPLLFVHGPPVFVRITVMDEESTSVFVQNWEESAEPAEFVESIELVESVENEQKEEKPIVQMNSSVSRRMAYLNGPFQKEVYRPLKFDLGDETLEGALGKIEGDSAFIELNGTEEGIVTIEISAIKEIFWRGKPFAEE